MGSGVLLFTSEQVDALQECQSHKSHVTESVLIRYYLFGIGEGFTFVECWTVALQVQPRFRNT